jgi:hypothetical protein
MGKINWGRVILGGIVAGIVIDVCEGLLNALVFGKQWDAVMTGLGRVATMSTKQLAAFNVWGLAVGIITVWLYASMRPRYGAGPRTAMCAGLASWVLVYALGFGAAPVFLHIFPVGLMVPLVALEIVEMLLAGLAGAAIYKEDSAPAARSAAA